VLSRTPENQIACASLIAAMTLRIMVNINIVIRWFGVAKTEGYRGV
jgi:hypothetical protein